VSPWLGNECATVGGGCQVWLIASKKPVNAIMYEYFTQTSCARVVLTPAQQAWPHTRVRRLDGAGAVASVTMIRRKMTTREELFLHPWEKTTRFGRFPGATGVVCVALVSCV